MTLRDPDIRAPLLEYLHSLGHLTVTEFTTHDARADVVAITDTDLVAYEIKSDVDTNARLSRQVESYDKVATRLYLVTTAKKLPKMLPILPPWWGVLVATETPSGVTFHEHLDARDNPAWLQIVAMKLLWTPELDIIMSSHDMPLRQGKPKGVRVKRIATTLGDKLSRHVWLSTLRQRYTLHPELRGPNKPVLSRL